MNNNNNNNSNNNAYTVQCVLLASASFDLLVTARMAYKSKESVSYAIGPENEPENEPAKKVAYMLHCFAVVIGSAIALVARCCSLLFVCSLSMTIVVLLVKMSMPLSRNRFASSHFGNYTSSGLDNASNGTLWFCYCLRTSQRVCERTSGSILLRVGVTFIVFKEKHRGGWCVLFTA